MLFCWLFCPLWCRSPSYKKRNYIFVNINPVLCSHCRMHTSIKQQINRNLMTFIGLGPRIFIKIRLIITVAVAYGVSINVIKFSCGICFFLFLLTLKLKLKFNFEHLCIYVFMVYLENTCLNWEDIPGFIFFK